MVALLGVAVLAASITTFSVITPRPNAESNPQVKTERNEAYPLHSNVTATIFWVGEAAGPDNDYIQNQSSAWLDDWQGAFGGVDDPNNRCGDNHFPCGFIPKENPYYFALPYNDLDDSGVRKVSAQNIPWYEKVVSDNPTSIVKNHWVKISYTAHGEAKTAYGQWEDAGPFFYDDFDYVFKNTKKPTSDRAGIDLSPALAAYLGVPGRGVVTWQFVDMADIPEGPWKQIITTSN